MRSTKTISRTLVETAVGAMGGDEAEDIREDYSGRGTYGRQCLAVDLDGESEIGMLAAELAYQSYYFSEGDLEQLKDRLETVVNLMDALRVDSMGRGVVAYFPGWELAD